MSGPVYELTDPDAYRRLDLRAHELLADVPLHDVWQVELPGGPKECSLYELRPYLRFESLSEINPVVRGLFALRSFLGRVLGWDASAPSSEPDARSFVHRLRDDDRRRSRVPTGSFDGPFRVLFFHDREAVSEIRNATVHAFSAMALERRPDGHRLYWAIYVQPVGRITGAYMALIDPFRRFLVYPAILRHLHRSWIRDHPRS